ncbi:MAG: PilX N-terminal domain-containing pilus assembly protein [Porticoccaceae bacterium]
MPTAPRSRQQGLVLPLALILLVVLTLAGVGAARVNILQERMVAATHNRQLAFQAGEAALREGERFLQQAALPAFSGSGGLYLAPLPSAPSVWDGWSASDWGSNGIAYGGTLGEVAAQPVYIIEELARTPGSGGSLASGQPQPETVYYRITARAVGGNLNNVVLLQSIYRRE